MISVLDYFSNDTKIIMDITPNVNSVSTTASIANADIKTSPYL